MRIRTTLIAAAGAALFAFAGAGTAQAHEKSDLVVDHATSAGAYMADSEWWGAHQSELAAWAETATFIAMD